MAVGSIATYLAGTTNLLSNIGSGVLTLTWDGTATDSADAEIQSGNTAARILSTGRYLIIPKFGVNYADLGNNNRHVMRTDIQIGGVSLPSTSGRVASYGRDSGSADEGHAVVVSYVDHTVVGSSADDITIDVQNFGDTANPTADQLANQSSLQIVRMPDDSPWLRVTRTSNLTVTPGGFTTTRPVDSDFQTISWENQLVETDASVIEWISGTDVALKATGWYLVLLNLDSSTANARLGMASKLMLNDANINGQSMTYNMMRGIDGANEDWSQIAMLVDADNDVLTVDVVNDSEQANDPTLNEACLTVVYLGTDADLDIVSAHHSSSRAGETTGVYPFNAESSDPESQHDTVTNNSRINGTADDDNWLFLGGYAATTTTVDSSRVTEHFRFTLNGAIQAIGDFLGYHRGDQSTTGLFMGASHGAFALPAFGSGDYVELNLRQESGGGNQNRDFLANRVGLQALRLNFPSGGGQQAGSVSETVDLSSSQNADAEQFASVTQAVDITDAYLAAASLAGQRLEAIDITDAITVVAQASANLLSQVDFASAETAELSVAGNVSEQTELSDTHSSLAAIVGDALSAVELAMAIVATAAAEAAAQSQVDFGDTHESGSNVAGAVSEQFDVLESSDASMLAAAAQSENVEFSDAASGAGGNAADVSEQLDLAESATAISSQQADATELVEFSESADSQASISDDTAESVDIGESADASMSAQAARTDAVEFDESLTAVGGNAGAVSEQFDLTESSAATSSQQSDATELVELSDDVDSQQIGLADQAENVELSDSLIGAGGNAASISESVELSEASTAISGISAASIENADLSDAVTAIAAASRSIASDMTLADTLESLAQSVASLSAAVTFAESVTGATAGITSGSIVESLDLSDSGEAIASAAAVVLESATLGASWAAAAVMLADRSDLVEISDSANAGNSISALILEDVELTESFAAAVASRASSNSHTDFANSYEQTLAALGSASDILDLTDAFSAQYDSTVSLAEALTLADAVAGTVGEILAGARIVVENRNQRIRANCANRNIDARQSDATDSVEASNTNLDAKSRNRRIRVKKPN